MIEIVKKSEKDYRFTIKSDAGSILFQSIAFKEKETLREVVSNLNKNGKKNLNFERKTNYKGGFQYFVKDASGTYIGQSLSYTSEAGMENGIKNLAKSIAAIKAL